MELCVTTWGAVLELRAMFNRFAIVADPACIDSGMMILISELKLVIRKKNTT